MNKINLIGGVIAASLFLPGIASASFLLDTGAPSTDPSNPALVLNSSSWVAAEFSATAGQEITTLSAFVDPGVGAVGDQFTFDIYSSTNFTGRANTRVLLDSVTATFTGTGWNTATADYTLPSSPNSDYWVALQVSTNSSGAPQTNGLSLPEEASTSTGTEPALGFAFLGPTTASEYKTAGALPVGLEVSTVPLPGALWLLGSGLAGLGAMVKRRRAA